MGCGLRVAVELGHRFTFTLGHKSMSEFDGNPQLATRNPQQFQQ